MKYRLNCFLTTSTKELIDITKAWFAISLAFGIVLGGLTIKFYTAFIISAIAVGLGFLLHELSHKFFAQKYGFKAEFRSFDEMLFLAVIMSFFGFVIAAPGAVMIFTNIIDKRKNGIISVAGPAMNIILALIFLLLVVFLTGGFNSTINLLNSSIHNLIESSLLKAILAIGFLVNSWLALFNMIPLWLFDGAKVFRWNKFVYFAVLIVAIVFVFGI